MLKGEIKSGLLLQNAALKVDQHRSGVIRSSQVVQVPGVGVGRRGRLLLLRGRGRLDGGYEFGVFLEWQDFALVGDGLDIILVRVWRLEESTLKRKTKLK